MCEHFDVSTFSAPGQRVMFLLKDDDGDGTGCDESRPALFTEMGELTKIGIGNDQEWRETVSCENDICISSRLMVLL